MRSIKFFVAKNPRLVEDSGLQVPDNNTCFKTIFPAPKSAIIHSEKKITRPFDPELKFSDYERLVLTLRHLNADKKSTQLSNISAALPIQRSRQKIACVV